MQDFTIFVSPQTAPLRRCRSLTPSDLITSCSKTPSDEVLISPEGVFYLRKYEIENRAFAYALVVLLRKTRIYRADHRFLSFNQRLFNSPFAVKHSRAGQKHDIIIVDKWQAAVGCPVKQGCIYAFSG